MPGTFLGPGEVKCCQGRASQQWNKLLLGLKLKALAIVTIPSKPPFFFKQEIIVKRKGSSKWKDEKLCLFLSFKVCFSQAF